MSVKYPTSVETGSGDKNSKNQISTITARNGFNFYERQAMHTLEYKCISLQEDWQLQTNLDSLADPDVSHWAPAEILGECAPPRRRTPSKPCPSACRAKVGRRAGAAASQNLLAG